MRVSAGEGVENAELMYSASCGLLFWLKRVIKEFKSFDVLVIGQKESPEAKLQHTTRQIPQVPYRRRQVALLSSGLYLVMLTATPPHTLSKRHTITRAPEIATS